MIKSWSQFGCNDDIVNPEFECELQTGVINTHYQKYGSYLKNIWII